MSYSGKIYTADQKFYTTPRLRRISSLVPPNHQLSVDLPILCHYRHHLHLHCHHHCMTHVSEDLRNPGLKPTKTCRPSPQWSNHNSAPTSRSNLKWPLTPGSKPWSLSQSGTGSQPGRGCLSWSGGTSLNPRSKWLQKWSQKTGKMREKRNLISL